MRTIRIFGELGDRFGDQFQMDVGNAAEALRALDSQLKGFKNFVLNSEKAGGGYVVKINGSELTDKKEFYIGGAGDISIVPVIAGSNGEGRLLIGAVLIAASFFTGPAGPYFMNAGIAMSIGGAAEILTRGMIPSSKPFEKPDNQPSYSFSGPVNTNAQGQCVPICYGIHRVGGAVISASIQTENLQNGYEYVDQEDSKICWACFNSTNFFGTLPANWTRKELLSYVPRDPTNNYSWDKWEYRVYFNKKVLVLREL